LVKTPQFYTLLTPPPPARYSHSPPSTTQPPQNSLLGTQSSQHSLKKNVFSLPSFLPSFLPSSSSSSLQTSPTSNSPLSPSSNSNLEAPNKHAKRSIFFLETPLNPFFFAFVCSQQAPSPRRRRLLLLLLLFLLSFSGTPGLLFPSQSRRRSKSANKQNKCEDLNTKRGRRNESSNK